MLVLIAFLALGALCLSLLGHFSVPPHRRPAVRDWTPVYLADQVGVGLQVLFDAGADRAQRLEELIDQDRLRQDRGLGSPDHASDGETGEGEGGRTSPPPDPWDR